jgi:hypothetical protein
LFLLTSFMLKGQILTNSKVVKTFLTKLKDIQFLYKIMEKSMGLMGRTTIVRGETNYWLD